MHFYSKKLALLEFFFFIHFFFIHFWQAPKYNMLYRSHHFHCYHLSQLTQVPPSAKWVELWVVAQWSDQFIDCPISISEGLASLHNLIIFISLS